MRIHVDENLPFELVEELTKLGHDVEHVRSVNLSGRTDRDVWDFAQAEGRLLVSQDIEFSDARRMNDSPHFGFVLVRLDQSRRGIIQRVREAFASERVEEWRGAIVVITERKVRVRRGSQP